MSTYMPKAGDITRTWYILDAEGQSLGRVAAKAAHILRGKHKPTYAPHADCGELGLSVHDFPYAIEDGIFILGSAYTVEDLSTDTASCWK